jgi:putative ABC transport system permease protein
MMRLLALFGMALASLRHHLTRSVLTMLGVVFGVAAVVSMLAISEGARTEALGAIAGMGLQNVLVQSVKPSAATAQNNADKKKSGGYFQIYGLTFQDRDHLMESLSDLEQVTVARVVPQKIFSGSRRIEGTILATEPEYLRVAGLRVAKGRFLRNADSDQRLNVAVLGRAVAKDLFQFEDPIGGRVHLGQEYFEVVGVLAESSSSGGGTGRSADLLGRSIFIPETTGRSSYGLSIVLFEAGSRSSQRVEIDDCILTFKPQVDVLKAANHVRLIMQKARPDLDWRVVVPRELLEAKQRTQRIFTIVMGSIAGISLLVGGIGIMNIMLASVLERTREIGVRRALGARRIDIVWQFLIESVVLCLLGGCIGIGVGILGAHLVSSFAAWKTEVSLWSVLLAMGVSVFVGVVFGLYPAMKAAWMRPVEALRRE